VTKGEGRKGEGGGEGRGERERGKEGGRIIFIIS